MKDCPFCGSRAELKKESSDRQADSYYTPPSWFVVRCTNCGASSGKVIYPYFYKFTEYRVEDFRRNPALRAAEDALYEDKLEQLKELAIAHWEKRHAI